MIEKEINLKINNFNWLLNYLNSIVLHIDSKIIFHYFNTEGVNYYIRLEEQDKWNFITIKTFNKWNDLVKTRTEITTNIHNIEDFIEILKIIWLEYSWVKSKIRYEYKIDNLIIDIDQWYLWKFEEYIESRCEIEWDNIDEILKFVDKIKMFTEITNDDLNK
jgi:adenylate cyclase class IV